MEVTPTVPANWSAATPWPDLSLLSRRRRHWARQFVDRGERIADLMPAPVAVRLADLVHAAAPTDVVRSYETWKAIADAFVEKHGRGKMWPSVTHPTSMTDERKSRIEQSRVARGAALGLQALALWAVKVANPDDKTMSFKRPGTMRGKLSRGRPRVVPAAPRVDVAAAVKALESPTRERRMKGGFWWRGTWRPTT